ncbi:hypothetical protein [Collimonas antrihumi]|uniref:hypothetical protein n=1 Tax=Collimonas antrihumi TaxID=1940615 RepID=UPI001B8C7BF8|nr:hypothetical protein [Collimonas antrihumi]
MNKTNLAWTVAALVLGAGGIYAVCPVDDSIAQAKTRNVVAAQDNSSFLSSPMVTSSVPSSTPSPALSSKAQDAVNINPFGK